MPPRELAAPFESRALTIRNHPDALDPALCRAGRFDVRILFSLATRRQARDIFVRFYDDTDVLTGVIGAAADKEGIEGGARVDDNRVSNGNGEELGVEGSSEKAKSTHDLADRFAAAVCPELDDDTPSKLSIAQLQAYLLVHKEDPERAVREAGEWARDGKAVPNLPRGRGAQVDSDDLLGGFGV